MKITYSAYQCLYGTSKKYISLFLPLLPTFSESEAACLVGTVKF